MDATHKGTLYGGSGPGGPRALSCLDDVGADVRTRAQFADPANEDMNPAKGDPVPILN
mgnify:CR=1 FL=1